MWIKHASGREPDQGKDSFHALNDPLYSNPMASYFSKVDSLQEGVSVEKYVE